LTSARWRMTRRAIHAPRRGHSREGPGKDDLLRGTQKGYIFEKRRRAGPKCNNDIRDRGPRQELGLGSKETFYEALEQIIGLEVAKPVFGPWTGLREVTGHCGEVDSLRNERRDGRQCRSIDHSRNFFPHRPERNPRLRLVVVHLDLFPTCQRTTRVLISWAVRIKWSEAVGEWVIGLLWFSSCELLVLEAGSWGTVSAQKQEGERPPLKAATKQRLVETKRLRTLVRVW
jgi:hypothetical protein